MKITSVLNPVWITPENNVILCDIKVDIYGNEIMKFSASPLDSEEHGRVLFAELIAGVYGEIAEYVAPVKEIGTISAGSQTL